MAINLVNSQFINLKKYVYGMSRYKNLDIFKKRWDKRDNLFYTEELSSQIQTINFI